MCSAFNRNIHVVLNTNFIIKQQKHIIRKPVADCCSVTFGHVVRNQNKKSENIIAPEYLLCILQ